MGTARAKVLHIGRPSCLSTDNIKPLNGASCTSITTTMQLMTNTRIYMQEVKQNEMTTRDLVMQDSVH